MRKAKRLWLLGLIGVLALLFSGLVFASSKNHCPSKSDLNPTSKLLGKDVKLPLEFKPIPMDELNRPVYKSVKKMLGNDKSEYLCDDGYYWMGGPAYTADTDGNAMVWGAGGNLYFAKASDPTHPVEMWWGDIPLRIRIHNGIALVYCYIYTYSFDVSDPLNPAWLSYGPGLVYGFLDAYPSPDDSYWILTDWAFTGGLTVWDPATLTYYWGPIPPYNGGWLWDLHIDDEQKVLIAGDWSLGYFEFWDISDLMCSPPTYIGSIDDTTNPYGSYNTGLVFYKDDYLYGNFEAWQYYNVWIMEGLFGIPVTPDNFSQVSVYHVPDLHNPDNHYWVKMHWDASYDIVSMKKANEHILLTHYQNRVGLWTDQFETHLKSGFFGTTAGYYTCDGAYMGTNGLVTSMEGGARFFADAPGTTFTNTGVYWTGGFAADVVPNGNYLYVPSGYAGLGIIDNTDPTYPVTYSYLWDFTGNGLWYATAHPNGNYVYVSDGSQNVWVINVTNKLSPTVVSVSNPYMAAGNVIKLTMLANILVVGTTAGFELVNVSNPSNLTQIDGFAIAGGVNNVKSFTHPAYPDQLFLAAVAPHYLYTFYFDGSVLHDSGSLNFAPITANTLYDVEMVGQIAYVLDRLSNIYVVKMISQSPNIYFDLNRTGVTDMTWNLYACGYCGGVYPPYDYPKLATIGGYLVTYAMDPVYGYPALFLIDIVTNPLAPTPIPYPQLGVLPFDFLTGLNSYGNYVYYASDFFGTGAVSFNPDLDNPILVAGPAATPAIADAVPGHSPNPTYWIQGTVTLSVSVEDATSSIKQVVFKFKDGSRWRTIKRLTTSTPAGQVGVYTYNWDTTKWIYTGTGPSPIRVEVTDAGCNTVIYDSAETYAINMPPKYEIEWDPGCNYPPSGGLCEPAGTWIVCGDLCFTVWGYTRPDSGTYKNEVPTPAAPKDDISQIAYRIDGGSWVLYPVPNSLPDGNAQTWSQYICIDTTTLSEGSHTLEFRVTDDCGLSTYKDINGQSTWTFIVHNEGPKPYITSPMAGDLVRGSAIRVAAKMHNELEARPIKIVKFYLDPTDYNNPFTGALIGTATTKDSQGEYSFIWDATSFPYGDHVLVAVAWENAACCNGPFTSPIVSFNLIAYTPMSVTATASPTSGQAPLSVVFAASVTGGQGPYTYSWNFGDGQTGTGNVVAHTYSTAGNYTATVTVTDNTGATATASVNVSVTAPPVTGPTITSVVKATQPFRLHIYGTNFKPGCVVKINNVAVPMTTYKDSSHVVAKKGAALKAMCPKGVTVKITVVNPDGTVSNEFNYTR